MARAIYVEALIRTDLARLWQATQDPAAHQRWDVRFTEITYLAGENGEPAARVGASGGVGPAGEARRFRYRTRILPGLTIGGTGVCGAETGRPDGSRTSVLRFASPHPLSLIRSGGGYWRYVPAPGGIRFLTGYGYQPGWGRAGRVADLVFRPVFGWATAWSFDRLRLWLERGTPPEALLRRSLADAALRLALIAALIAGLAAAVPGLAGVLGGVSGTVLVLLAPPLPGTPSARRCLRRPPDRTAGAAPAVLRALARP